MTPAQYILYEGRTYPVKARVRSNGIDCLAIQDERAIMLVPLAVAQAAPARSAPRLCCVGGEMV